MVLKKNIPAGKNKINLLFIILIVFFSWIDNSFSKNKLEGSYTDLKILDKISSKNTLLKLKNGDLKTPIKNQNVKKSKKYV